MKSNIIENNKNHLQDVIALIEMDLPSVNNLDAYVAKVKSKTDLRITVVNGDGVVIAESDYDKKDMHNHAARYEILEANNKEYSHTVRYSQTLKVDFLYVVKRITYKENIAYVRVSKSLGKLLKNFYSLLFNLGIAFFIVILIAFYISKAMGKKIVYDLEQVTDYLDEISNKNYKAAVKIKYFKEFLEISIVLKNLAKKLNNKDKQKRKYTAKLRLMNKQRDEILSAISHEFKNPIASIMGYAQTLQQDPKVDLRIRDKFLSKIISNAEKISKMLDRLALSVKLENRDLDIHLVDFDLAVLCEDIATNLLSKYKDRKIHVDVQKCIVNADKTMIELVLINLVDNALKYSQDDVTILLENNTLFVKDNGIGIQEEHIDKVTSKFYRVYKNSWDNSMGIGLAMVDYILKAHNTVLNIASKFGKGSSFSFSVKELLKK
jgi:signal transduction histidine kinase